LRLFRVQDKKEAPQVVATNPDISQLEALIKESEKNIYHQVESLIGLYNTLNIHSPLPPMRGWAISPDFAGLMVREILAKRPETIVELGSGVSTLISAYALSKLKRGKVVSYDHDIDYGTVTRQNIDTHGLGSIAEVKHAPISKIMLGETSTHWYAINEDTIPEKIDMLIIDGPPARTAPYARYPALPFFLDYLAEDAIVIMDDGIRNEEKEICQRWIEEYPEFESEYIETEKGTFILRRKREKHA
jgi:predicted O-methyltransferase YrrM